MPQGPEAALIHWLNRPWGSFLDALMFAASAIGDWGIVWWAVIIALALLSGPEGRRLALWLTLAIVLSFAIDQAIKVFSFRPRPYMLFPDLIQMGHMWADSSLPSGHASSSMAATIVLLRHDRVAGLAAAIYMLLSAVSRPHFAMHWPTDVLVGFLTGTVAGLLTLLIRRWATRRSRRQAS